MIQKPLRNIKATAIAYSFLAPSLIGLALFTLFPVVLSLVTSFSDWNFAQGLKGIKLIGLGNFTDLFRDEWFLASIRNNIIYAVFTVPVTMFIALIFAAMVEHYVCGKNVIRLMIYIPNITSAVVIAYVWQTMLSRKGIITLALSRVLGMEMPSWLGDPKWAMPVIIVMGIWGGIGYVFILYLSGLQNIPASLYEAAKLDGAGWIQAFRRITIPMLSPTTFFILITQIIFSFRVFAQIQILTQGGPGMSTTVTAYYIYVAAFRYYKMGYASAMTWILFMIIFVFTLIQWKGQKRRSIN